MRRGKIVVLPSEVRVIISLIVIHDIAQCVGIRWNAPRFLSNAFRWNSTWNQDRLFRLRKRSRSSSHFISLLIHSRYFRFKSFNCISLRHWTNPLPHRTGMRIMSPSPWYLVGISTYPFDSRRGRGYRHSLVKYPTISETTTLPVCFLKNFQECQKLFGPLLLTTYFIYMGLALCPSSIILDIVIWLPFLNAGSVQSADIHTV